ncbi:MAG: type III secretion system outer membrane ring subunit SctC [Woeseiaceae bacterium]
MAISKFPRRMIAMLVLATCTTASAVEPEWPQKTLTMQVQEQALPQFLKDFFAAIDMTVLVSDSVTGRISGKFDDAPEKIFDDIVKAYGLLPYFDGTVFHISPASRIQNRSFEMTSAQLDKVLKSLLTQGLSDRYQSVHVLRAENRIKVRGAPEFIADVESIVNAVAPKRKKTPFVQHVAIAPAMAPNELEFRTFSLQYASAADVTLVQGGREFTIPGVASILRSIVGDGQSPTITSMRFGPSGPQRVPGLREDSTVRPPAIDADMQIAQEIEPTQLTSGGVTTDRPFVARIEAERNLNAVIVRDYVDSMPVYEQLIVQLDQEPLLVEIQVTIIDVDKSEFDDLGVDWQYADARTQARFGGGEVVGQNGGLLLNTVLGDSGRFLTRVNALEVTGSADVVSRPQVLTLSNLEAVLASDQSFFVRVAGNEDVDLFNVTVGTTLRVVPSIVGSKDDPQIRLLVSIEDGSLTPDAVDEIPIIDKSSLSTQAIIYNGESLLLGGLVRESTISDETKVPVLGNVPLVGRLFKRKTDVKTSTERLFLITPTLVTGTRDIRNNTGLGANNRASRRTAPPRPAQYDVQAGEPQAYLDGF